MRPWKRIPRPAELWVVMIAISAVLSVIVFGAGLTFYVRHCASIGRSVEPPALRRNIVMKMLYERKDFSHFVDVVARTEPSTFRTRWDFARGTHLSKEQYLPTVMYGQERYRHKPNIRVLDLVLWSGLYRAIITARETPEVVEALRACKVLHQVSFETDELGFKKTDFAIRESVPSVLFLGDSFTEGLHVRSEDTFVNLFGRKMHEAGIEAVPVNAGVNGYGTLEEAWTAENFAGRVNTRVVIDNLFLNDAGDVEDVLEGVNLPSNYLQMFEYLERLALYCKGGSLDLVVSVVPAKEQMGPSPSYFQRRVHKWCSEHEVRFVNPLEYLRGHGAGQNYFSWDPHLNPKGHSNYATFLFAEVRPILQQRFGKERIATGPIEQATPPSR